ncbi:MAG: DRTGG domain-containing protein [Anaerolineae bacterium]
MTTLSGIVQQLHLEVVGSAASLERRVVAGYASDLLSCAMNRAKKDYVWVTLQSHANVVAVASLLDLAAVIITEGNRPDDETIARAEGEGVCLLLTPKTTFTVVGELTALGVRGEPEQP